MFESPRARSSVLGARFRRIRSWWVSVFVLLAIFSAVPARAAESLEQTIAFFLHRIETTDATFIRNGQAHRHPEDSIRLAAAKSLLTGQPYLVRTRDGKEMPLNTWLTDALREHRQHDGN